MDFLDDFQNGRIASISQLKSHIEVEIMTIWKELLNIEKIGLKDNFFDVGGYSLLLHQIRRKIQMRFNLKVSVIELFRYTTVESLSELILDKLKNQASLGKESAIDSDVEDVSETNLNNKRKMMMNRRKKKKSD